MPITAIAAAATTTSVRPASPTRILPRKNCNINAGRRKDRKKSRVGLRQIYRDKLLTKTRGSILEKIWKILLTIALFLAR